jgi:uncharacterized membrane protein
MTDPTTVRRLQQHHEGRALTGPLPAEFALMAGEPAPAGPASDVADVIKSDEKTPDHDRLWAASSYVAAIVLWLAAPLAVFLTRGRRSEFVRRHAVQAFRLTLTVTVFAISGLIVAGLLAVDSPRDALYIMGPVGFVFAVVVLWYLVRAAGAARRGQFYPVPSWLVIRGRPTRARQ